MILKNKLCGSAARLGRGFQTRPLNSKHDVKTKIKTAYDKYMQTSLDWMMKQVILIKVPFCTKKLFSSLSVCTGNVNQANLLNLGPNKHGLVTYIQVNVYIGNTLSWLNGGFAFKTDVCCRLNNHISVISRHICDFSSKSNGSIYYLEDCIVIFIESLSVFMNISKKN